MPLRKAVVHAHPQMPHQLFAANIMTAGLKRHGIEVEAAPYNTLQEADVIVTWGWRQDAVIDAARAKNIPILVMERGNIQPREEWISCGWNGLGNRAIYAPSLGPERWETFFAHHLRPWKPTLEGFSLVCGQIPGDKALRGQDIVGWSKKIIEELLALNREVRFRPHPQANIFGEVWRPHNVMVLEGSLAEAFLNASEVSTFNSTVAVEAVLAGISTVTFDLGSMAWDVTRYCLEEPKVFPDRAMWCEKLAWTQWSSDEIKNGEAWEALQAVKPLWI